MSKTQRYFIKDLKKQWISSKKEPTAGREKAKLQSNQLGISFILASKPNLLRSASPYSLSSVASFRSNESYFLLYLKCFSLSLPGDKFSYVFLLIP